LIAPPSTRTDAAALRHDWSLQETLALFQRPFHDLLFEAQSTHRRHFDAQDMQLSTLLNIKSGGCPEDCAYCPQSVRHATGVQPRPLLEVQQVRQRARAAKRAGASRFCLGAAWRSPRGRDFERVLDMVAVVRQEGLESCATLGMLNLEQARRLKQAGLDYYNHNIDTSPEFYRSIITTRRFADRLRTLEHVREAGLAVCCGGIIGMGETLRDRAEMLRILACLPRHPESVPINLLVRVEGTPLATAGPPDPFELVRTVAVARLLMPASRVRLSAGRDGLDEALQALCFHAGANSIFYGEKLLTTGNPEVNDDRNLLRRLDMHTGTQP